MRRIASDRDESPLASASWSKAAVMSRDSRMAVTGSCPVGGRPFFRSRDTGAILLLVIQGESSKEMLFLAGKPHLGAGEIAHATLVAQLRSRTVSRVALKRSRPAAATRRVFLLVRRGLAGASSHTVGSVTPPYPVISARRKGPAGNGGVFLYGRLPQRAGTAARSRQLAFVAAIVAGLPWPRPQEPNWLAECLRVARRTS
jgi:hypothetical protein